MQKFSVNTQSVKATFKDTDDIIIIRGSKSLSTKCADVKTVLVKDGKVQAVTDAFYKLTGELRKRADFVKIEVIGYLARCTDEPFMKSLGVTDLPSISVQPKAFGKNVNPGHAFKAELDIHNGEDRDGIYVPESFKPFIAPKQSCGIASMGTKISDSQPIDAPHPAEDPANFDVQV